ncbi:hypothetical protein [Amycolatopsis speibonae]|uniref:Uncharacterized protein n=1 Tax=Amycolatopsis speibonae TaxID=1450224 RepID=A0ABV7P4U8_9PSEU
MTELRTGMRVTAHRLDRMGSVVIGELMPYDDNQGERVREEGTGDVWCVVSESVRPAEFGKEGRNPLIDPDDECQDLRCTRLEGICVGYHCARCGEPTGMLGHTVCVRTESPEERS